MGLTNPSGGGGGGGTTLTAQQLAKINALPHPSAYDDGRKMTTRTYAAVSGDASLALAIDDSAITDVSSGAHAITLGGSAAVSSTEVWSGDSSLSIPNGASDVASASDHADFNLGANDFDIRFAGWHATAAGDPWQSGAADGVGQWDSNPNLGWHLSLRSNGAGTPVLTFGYSTVGSDIVETHSVDITGLVSPDQWHHYRAVRISNILELYVDEIKVYSGDITGVTIHDSGADLTIGNHGASAEPWNGYLDGIYAQVGGTIADDFRVQRHLYASSETVAFQPEHKMVAIPVTAFGPTTDVVTHASDAVYDLEIPEELAGYRVHEVIARHSVAGAGGTASNIKITLNGTALFSADLTIDSTETSSSTAATAAIIDRAQNTLVTGQVLKVLLTAADSSTVPKGLQLTIRAQSPSQ